jgi:twinkle protein
VSTCIYPKLDCTSCNGTETVQRFENTDSTITATCMKCKKYHDENSVLQLIGQEVKIKKEPKDHTETIKEIMEDYPVRDLPDRGLKAGCLKRFDVRVGLSMSDGQTVVEHYYPSRIGSKVIALKVRLCEQKKFYIVGTTKDVEPFGWREAISTGGYTLYITEGELDAMSLYTVFKREKKQDIAVISLRQGATSAAVTLQPVLKDITDKFKQVVLVPDQDEAGEAVQRDCRSLFPEGYPVKVAKYTEKDANAMLLAGKAGELVRACYNAGEPLTQGLLIPDDDMYEELKKPPERGLSYPWPRLTKLARGMRRGEVIYWGAPPKMGKSTIVNELASWFIQEHKEKVLLIKPEEQAKNTLRRISGAIVGKVFHDPDIAINPDDVDKAHFLIGDKCIIFDKWQTPKWEETRQLIRVATLTQGVKNIFLDPLTNFTLGMSGSERNDFLIGMTRELAEDAANYGYTAHVFCHFNKAPKGDKQWSEGRVPSSDDFQGSSSMAQACNMMIGIQGWKLTSGEDKDFWNSQRVLHILEEREFGVADSIDLVWQPSRGKLKEKEYADD